MPTPKEKIGHGFTAVVFARNEHERLPIVLRNLSNLVNVLVVDNFSTDDTVEIAKSFGRDVIQVSNVGGFVETPAVLDPVWARIKTEYLLICACAEILPPTLLEYYDGIATTRSYDVVRVDRISLTAGLNIPIDLPPKWLKFRYHGEVRFFSRGKVDYSGNKVHGRGNIIESAKVVRAPHGPLFSIIQYRDYDSSETEYKHRVYNDEIGSQYLGGGRGLIKSIIRALGVFVIRYFIYGGIFYGGVGFIHCYYRLHMELGIGFRGYEYRNKLLKEDIVRANKIKKEEMLEHWGDIL